ncbi:MAG: hypothetical protein ABH817_01815 [archaeon]
MNFLKTLKQIRNCKRNFNQTVDLIIVLTDFDVKRDSLNTSVILPNVFKEKKISAFLEKKQENKEVYQIITKSQLDNLDPKEFKKTARESDFFLSNAKLMPAVAKNLGKVLGGKGKMPDPKIGCVIVNEDAATISQAIKKLQNIVKIKAKDKSVKIAVGKEDMEDQKIAENIEAVYKKVVSELPKKEQSIKHLLLKVTMGKPVKVENEK